MLSLQDLCEKGAIVPEKVLDHLQEGRVDTLLELDVELSSRHESFAGQKRYEAARRPAPLVARLVSLLKPAQEAQDCDMTVFPQEGKQQRIAASRYPLSESAFQAIRLLVLHGASLEHAASALRPFRCGTPHCDGTCPGRFWHIEARARLLELMRIAHAAGRGVEVFSSWDSNDLLEVVLYQSCSEEIVWLHLCGVRPHAALRILTGKLKKLKEEQEEEEMSDLSLWLGFEDFAEPDYKALEISVLEHCTKQLQAWKFHVDSCSWGVLIERDFQRLGTAASLLWKFIWDECNCAICEHGRRVKVLSNNRVPTTPPSSSESSVIELVHHLDPPAVRDPEVARDTVEIDWVDHVASHLRASSTLPTDIASVDQEVMPVEGPREDSDVLFLLQFKRHPHELKDILLGSHALLQCRQGLTDRGYSYELPSQALVFVHACQYREVMGMIEQRRLKQSHVLVARSLLYLVEEALSMIPSRRRPSHTQEAVGELKPPFLIGVIRTLIGVIPRPLAPSEVTQSTTEAHGAFNPRRRTSMKRTQSL